MAVCEGQLESGLARLNREGNDETSQEPTLPAGLPLTVDYRSPVSHFVPPHVELYAARHKQGSNSNAESPETSPVKRKRGRPRVDKTSPEYLANVAARKQAREMAAMARGAVAPPEGKRKRGRPRLDKTSPEYLARKRARELEALERKAKREYKRRSTADSGASSSTGDTTPRVKRKYTKRAPSAKKNDGQSPGGERVKGKRGRPRKDAMSVSHAQPPKIRVRSNLMPVNNEPISLDSDDEPDLGSPGAASDSLSLDENLRALRHIHEKYANIDKDELYEAHLLAANFKKPPDARAEDDVLSVRSSEGGASVKELETRVEKLEDSSNSDSDSSSSGSDSSSSGSSSSSSCSSDSSSSDSETEDNQQNNHVANDTYPSTPWQPAPADSDSDPERGLEPAPPSHDEISESENESPDKSFQCHICRKWYSTRVTLKIHRRSHQSRGGGARARSRASDRYTCDICPAAFPRREKLFQHKAEAHRGSMTFRCSVCSRCFEHDDELARHTDTHTQDERNGRCTDCAQTFDSYAQLTSHRAHAHAAPADSSSPHTCAHCGKRFTHVHSLTRHLHNHAKQLYRCVVCKASFARADQLAQHLNSHLANYKRLKP